MTMRAIRIDPEQGNVERIDVDPADVAQVLGVSETDTIEFEDQHCLVIQDGDHTTEHPARFRFTRGPARPFFGPALILGVEHGNWTPATMDEQGVIARIIWEEWDSGQEGYAVRKHAPEVRSN